MSETKPTPQQPTPVTPATGEEKKQTTGGEASKKTSSPRDCCDLQIAEYHRNLIAAEQTLINNRMTWMMTFQGFLFATYAVAMNKENDVNTSELIFFIIPLAGMFMAFFSIFGLIAAHFAIDGIKAKFNKLNLEGGLVAPFSKSWTAILGRIGAFSFPIVIIITWIVIFFKGPGYSYLFK
ncbi:MAG: hypothetical protein SFU20_06590 [Chitinophagaceae bacterium]|nr:hypothetical protein [Chitinophagaceae bacterium]